MKRRGFSVVTIVQVTAVLATSLAAAEPVVLRGRVITLDGRPAPAVRLQLVGQAAQVHLGSASAEFAQTLNGAPSQVQVAIADSGLAVLYPLDGLVPVPRDPEVTVTIVVGKPESAVISDALAAQLLQLESTLHDRGVTFDAAQDSLSAGLRRILSRLGLRETDLRRDVNFQRERAAAVPRILRAIDGYVRELKDLRDGLRQFPAIAVENSGGAFALAQAMLEYNAAFTELDDHRHAFDSELQSYWAPERSAALRGALDDVYEEAAQAIHAAIVLPLNPPLIAIQNAHGHDHPSRRDVEAAVKTLALAADAIDRQIPTLVQRADALRADLQQE